jgi:hypothetical protein
MAGLSVRVKHPTQKERVLEVFKGVNGDWVDGMVFLHIVPAITQYHARIFDLQEDGYRFESRFIEGKTWKEYRLLPQDYKQIIII